MSKAGPYESAQSYRMTSIQVKLRFQQLHPACSHNPDLSPYTGQLKTFVFLMIGLRDPARDICILRTCPVKFHPMDAPEILPSI